MNNGNKSIPRKHNYSLRGKCKEIVEKAIKENPRLKAVRGYYICPLWGRQAHWWCERPDGTIYDPSVSQFPTVGYAAEYEPLGDIVSCANCENLIHIDHATIYGNYSLCSTKCLCELTGVSNLLKKKKVIKENEIK